MKLDVIGWFTMSKLVYTTLSSTSSQLQFSLPSSLTLTMPGNIPKVIDKCQMYFGLFHVYCITQSAETELEPEPEMRLPTM